VLQILRLFNKQQLGHGLQIRASLFCELSEAKSAPTAGGDPPPGGAPGLATQIIKTI